MIDKVRVEHKKDGIFEALVTIGNSMRLVTSSTMTGLLHELNIIEKGGY